MSELQGRESEYALLGRISLLMSQLQGREREVNMGIGIDTGLLW